MFVTIVSTVYLVYVLGVLAALSIAGAIMGVECGNDNNTVEDMIEDLDWRGIFAWPMALAYYIALGLTKLYRTRHHTGNPPEVYRYSVRYEGEPAPEQPITITLAPGQEEVGFNVYRTTKGPQST